uniref:Uncharacterized protein n=1 Tax=Odontella aurita TaxID=265563 RepID=A0A7S4K5A3_9STRA|mmetsp:Transcript_61952/g.183023  ORF Transcript_61952/g.183023 Transcript_61952/m.183023 type:complete len:171 (+) Transcript_61952:980-1492(+)
MKDESTAAISSAAEVRQSQAVALWRAITRGKLVEAQELLLTLQLVQGTAFNFDDISQVTTEGTSVTSPATQSWSSTVRVYIVMLDQWERCLGSNNPNDSWGMECAQMCAELSKGKNACTWITHKDPRKKFHLEGPAWSIGFATSSRATKAKSFTSTIIALKGFPPGWDAQ